MLLIRQADTFSVIKLDPAGPIPQPPAGANFWSISLTHDELSLVCATDQTPIIGALSREDDWTAFRVAGTMDFSLTGVISKISEPIANAGLGIFVLSTFDTDYILIKTVNTDSAIKAWRGSTINVIEPTIQTARLILVELASEVAHIAVNERSNKDWAPDYPTEDDFLVAGLAMSVASEHLPKLPQAFQIRIRATGEAIGSISFKAEHSLGEESATEIGYSIVKSKQGEGFATEAIAGIISIARSRGIRYLTAETASVNKASQRVLIKNGFEEYVTQERLNNSQGNQNSFRFLLELQ
jgi:uncharacterized protein